MIYLEGSAKLFPHLIWDINLQTVSFMTCTDTSLTRRSFIRICADRRVLLVQATDIWSWKSRAKKRYWLRYMWSPLSVIRKRVGCKTTCTPGFPSSELGPSCSQTSFPLFLSYHTPMTLMAMFLNMISSYFYFDSLQWTFYLYPQTSQLWSYTIFWQQKTIYFCIWKLKTN